MTGTRILQNQQNLHLSFPAKIRALDRTGNDVPVLLAVVRSVQRITHTSRKNGHLQASLARAICSLLPPAVFAALLELFAPLPPPLEVLFAPLAALFPQLVSSVLVHVFHLLP